MTFTIHFGPWLWTALAVVAGFVLVATDNTHYSFIAFPGPRTYLGLLCWASIPFVWLGWWMR